MAIVSVKDLNKSYINKDILKDVNFHIEEGDKIGLVGKNGSGKTSLFRILAGLDLEDSGHIYIQKNKDPVLMAQHTKTHSTTSIFYECLSVFSHVFELENQMAQIEGSLAKHSDDPNMVEELMNAYMDLQEKYEKTNGASVHSRVTGTLKGLGFIEKDFDKEIKHLSGGQKSRVALAKLLLSDPEFMLLDEPTNHLDISAINWLENYLRNFPATFVLISHDRFFLDRTVNKIFSLENKSIKTYKGNYSQFAKQRKKDLQVQAHAYENQQQKLKKEEEIINRYLSSGKKNIFKQGQSRRRRLDNMLKDASLIDPVSHEKSAQIRFTSDLKAGHIIFNAKDLKKSYSKTIFENISFELTNGQRVGIIGPNGVGKSSLLKILAGEDNSFLGDLKVGSNVKIGYFDQEMADLDESNTIIDELWDAYPDLDHLEIRSYLAKMNFTNEKVFDEVSVLSGGEKSRLSLLKLMLSGANVLLMDEPTNHLDIESKEVLEDSLKAFDGTVVAISHDRYFLNNFSDKIWEMSSGGIVEYLGNYNYYLSKKESLNQSSDLDEEISQTQKQKLQKKRREEKRKVQKLNRQIKELEEKIQSLEDQIASIDQKLYDPDISSDYEKALELSSKRDVLSNELAVTFDMWADLQEE